MSATLCNMRQYNACWRNDLQECRKKLPFVGGVYCMKCGKPLETEEECCLDCKRKKHYFTQGVLCGHIVLY